MCPLKCYLAKWQKLATQISTQLSGTQLSEDFVRFLQSALKRDCCWYFPPLPAVLSIKFPMRLKAFYRFLLQHSWNSLQVADCYDMTLWSQVCHIRKPCTEECTKMLRFVNTWVETTTWQLVARWMRDITAVCCCTHVLIHVYRYSSRH